jgi:uncharacterized membrane protein YoaK (UPF0700 family)
VESEGFARRWERHLRLWLMMTLTFVTGMLDAVGYLGLDRVFTGNMTGNIVILGMGLAAEDALPVAGPLCALAGYVAGAAFVGRVLRDRPGGWNPVITGLFASSAVLLAAAGAVLATVAVAGASPLGIAIAACLAALMGAQAAAARFLSVSDMTTVVVTSTITALASETLFAPGWAWLKHRRVWAIVAIFAGAVVGALLMKIDIGIPVFVCAVATGSIALLGHLHWERVGAHQ